MTTAAKTERKTKICTSCGRRRLAGKFRMLSHGYLQGMCYECELAYERERWPHRPAYQRSRPR